MKLLHLVVAPTGINLPFAETVENGYSKYKIDEMEQVVGPFTEDRKYGYWTY